MFESQVNLEGKSRASTHAHAGLPGSRHAETDLWHEPEPGRLHRRVRRRPRLERAERRAVPVVVRPGGGDRPGAVRAKTVGDHELPLADRRPARSTGTPAWSLATLSPRSSGSRLRMAIPWTSAAPPSPRRPCGPG